MQRTSALPVGGGLAAGAAIQALLVVGAEELTMGASAGALGGQDKARLARRARVGCLARLAVGEVARCGREV